MHPNQILKKIKEDKVKFISLQFSDLLGAIKEVIIQAKEIEDAIENGIWFDGSSIEGFARIEESDLFLKPDLDTYSLVPWSMENGKTARIICDIFRPDGKPFEGDPRFILKETLKEAEKMGFEYNVGPEPEFYLFKNTEDGKKPMDGGGYFDLSSHDGYNLIKEIIEALKYFGINVETSHHEVGKGQYEIDFNYGQALNIADKLITLKYTVKKLAQMRNMKATFMPKPLKDFPGSGMHVHQSLFKNGKNIFFDEKDKYNLSETAYSFIAGQMKSVKSMCAILCPTINSYKRLVSGFEAPVYITWARMNRSALIRVPKWFGKKPNSARMEIRCPDPICNPYLAFSVMLKAGLEGVKRELKPPEPVEDNAYGFDFETLKNKKIELLPNSLGEALFEMERADYIKEVFGEHLFNKYIEIKKKELEEFRLQVTDWETKKYLDTY